MTMTRRLKRLCLLSIMTFLFVTTISAQSPYGWRGPDRSGYYSETGLLKSWPEEGPELLWETMDAGKGYSSPVIVGDRIYLTGMNEDEDKETFSAYSLDGKKIYEVEYGIPWNASYPDTRCTPTIEYNRAHIISGTGEIVCLNIANGDIVWKVNGGEQFQRKTGRWGASECPLVFDNKVIYTPSGNLTTMVALNAETGEVVWKTEPLGDTGAYVSPILVEYNGVKTIVGMSEGHILGVNPDIGNIVWKYTDWKSPNTVHNNTVNTPIYHNGHIFFSNGYNMGSIKLKLNTDSSDVSLVWRNDDLDTHHGGYVLVDGAIYGSNWINNNSGNWVGVDWETGETKFESQWRTNGKGSIIAADRMIYCYDERRGTVALVRPSTEKFDIVSEFRITQGDGPHWAHPVINDGVLYIRHGKALMAYKIK